MKKIVLLIIIIMFTLMSCNKDQNSLKDIEKTSLASENGNDDEIELIDKDDSNYDRLNEFYSFDQYESIQVRKINNDKYLIGLIEQYQPKLRHRLYIFDLHTSVSFEIPMNKRELVEEIKIEEDKIYIVTNGQNSTTSMKDTPKTYEVDISDFSIDSYENSYYFGDLYEAMHLGQSHNATKLQEVSFKDDVITFNFGQHETSILAGGSFSPHIEIISRDKEWINIDIENLFFNESQFNSLMELGFVKEIAFDEYENIDSSNHKIIRMNINGFEKFSCRFIAGEDGYLSLQIYLK